MEGLEAACESLPECIAGTNGILDVWRGGRKMTYDEIVGMLGDTGIPFAYDHFSEGESPGPPFLVFLFPSSRNFSADGKVYQRIDALHVELYTDRKQPDLEARLEDVLDAHDVFYEKTETWIESERLYEVLYSTEVIRTD